MLSLENLKEFTKKSQTIEKNIVREYVQHLFLSSLYKLPEAEKLLFKGGTALRFVYGSPRFSEDLDFTGENIYPVRDYKGKVKAQREQISNGVYRYQAIDTLFVNALSEIEKQGIRVDFKEAKPTTGGYLGIIHYELYDFIEDMKFEISLRGRKRLSKEITTIANDYAPAYTIVSLLGVEIVKGKTAALISRKKPRDYYDMYFFLRHPQLHKFVEKTQLKEVMENLEKEKINFKQELSILLPASHQLILKDFKKILTQEIKKYL